MNGDSPEPNRPLVASLHKGPFFYLHRLSGTFSLATDKKNRRINQR
ncbi:hypothetical protein [Citrobacter werkmanii]